MDFKELRQNRISHVILKIRPGSGFIWKPYKQKLGGQETLGRLRFDVRWAPPTGSPQRTDDNLFFVEGVVQVTIELPQVETTKAGHASLLVRRANTREIREDSEGGLEISCEQMPVVPVLKPPRLLAIDVSLCGRRKPDRTLRQCDLSSRRISSASMSRPAATSAEDWASASCNAARSASSSQSPGSRGSSSISVPSGREVGSSTRSLPSRTRAVIVMQESVALGGPPNKRLHLTADGVFS